MDLNLVQVEEATAAELVEIAERRRRLNMAVQLSYDSSIRSDYMELKAPYYNAIETSEIKILE